MKLSIITLTYNNLEYTRNFIKSLYENTKDFELILVDNGSTDGTVEYLKSLPYNNIKFIFNEKNLGFPKGNNQGLEIAEGEYIGFLNNDILLSSNWFEGVEFVFKNETDAAFVSPFHLNPAYYNVNEKNYIKYFK
ncbi:glycosyltransferase, partial [bacterium]|nr:glycosyltransferase [bacterium]